MELPNSAYTDALSRKGLAGHSAIMIGDEYYDYGPQPGELFFSKGRPWWDKQGPNGNLKKADVFAILNSLSERTKWNISGKVILIDIELSENEEMKLINWWKEKYSNPGHYSVIPVIGEQCTSNVRISIEECTSVFSSFSITSTT